jgi:hypothetical protein
MDQELLEDQHAGGSLARGVELEGQPAKRPRKCPGGPPCPGKGIACPGSEGCINPSCRTKAGATVKFHHPGSRKPDTPASVYSALVLWLGSKGFSVTDCPQLKEAGPHCLCECCMSDLKVYKREASRTPSPAESPTDARSAESVLCHACGPVHDATPGQK